MKIPKFASDVCNLIIQIKDLTDARNKLSGHVRDGATYFYQNKHGGQPDVLAQAADTMNNYLNKICDLDAEIQNLEMNLLAVIESGMLEYVTKVTTKEHTTEAGDALPSQELMFVPNYTEKEGVIEVTPNELFFIRGLQKTFKPQNIEFIRKEDYMGH